MVTIKRVTLAILKILIYVIAFLLLAIVIYYGINRIWLLEDFDLRNSLDAHKVEEQDISQRYDENRLAVIVGTASLLLAVLAMQQQHMSRYQDRALALPKMMLSQCQFYIGEKAVEENASFYNNKGGKLLIKIYFDEAFSPCYEPYIYRIKCAKNEYECSYAFLASKFNKFLRKRYVKKHYVRLEKQNNFSSFGKDGLCMEVVIKEPKLIQDFCEKMCSTRDYKLDMLIDVCWKNHLLMYGLRNMSKMYLRYELRLDDIRRIRPKENYYFYKIEDVKVKGAPLW